MMPASSTAGFARRLATLTGTCLTVALAVLLAAKPAAGAELRVVFIGVKCRGLEVSKQCFPSKFETSILGALRQRAQGSETPNIKVELFAERDCKDEPCFFGISKDKKATAVLQINVDFSNPHTVCEAKLFDAKAGTVERRGRLACTLVKDPEHELELLATSALAGWQRDRQKSLKQDQQSSISSTSTQLPQPKPAPLVEKPVQPPRPGLLAENPLQPPKPAQPVEKPAQSPKLAQPAPKPAQPAAKSPPELDVRPNSLPVVEQPPTVAKTPPAVDQPPPVAQPPQLDMNPPQSVVNPPPVVDQPPPAKDPPTVVPPPSVKVPPPPVVQPWQKVSYLKKTALGLGVSGVALLAAGFVLKFAVDGQFIGTCDKLEDGTTGSSNYCVRHLEPAAYLAPFIVGGVETVAAISFGIAYDRKKRVKQQ